MNRSLAAAALLVAVVLAACDAAADPSPSPMAPTPSLAPTPAPSQSPDPTPAPSETPSDPTDVTYQPATIPQAEDFSAATIIVPGGEGLIAVGFNGGFGSILWTSADGGRTWTDVTPPDFAAIGIASVAEYEGMLVGVGRGNTIDVEAEEAAVYLSDDGIEWRKVTRAEDMVGQLIDVVVTDDGLFAVGGVVGADAAGVWHSTDAEQWERIGGDFEHAFLWSITEGGPGLVAVGWRRNPDPDLAVWTSADAGVTWELAPDPEGFAGFEATDVASLPDGSLAMIGSAFDGSGGRFWHSTDGVAWSLVHETQGAWPRTLTATPIGLVAAGTAGEMMGGAWLSADGVAWSTLGEPVEGAYFTAVHATDDGLLFGGATQAGTLETGIQARAAIWRATFD